jgi:hypothetical protein
MLMAELTTAVANKLSVKIIILKNNSLAEVKFEQKEIGNPEYGCTLTPIDFVAFAKAWGAEGFRCERPEEVRSAIQAALNSPGVAWSMPRKSRRRLATQDLSASRFVRCRQEIISGSHQSEISPCCAHPWTPAAEVQQQYEGCFRCRFQRRRRDRHASPPAP